MALAMPTMGVGIEFEVGSGTFTSVAPYWRGGTIQRGSSRVESPIIRYDASTATAVLKNADRRFDPTNLSGPYVDTGVTQVKPMRRIAYDVTWEGVVYNLFRGYIDAWDLSYLKSGNYSEASLTATDGFKVLANVNRAAVGAVGAGEDSGARIDRILDSADWDATLRDIATGDTTLQQTTLEGGALDEMQLVADTEIGELYINGAGEVVFRNRNAVYTETRSSTSQATFGDGGLGPLDSLLIPSSDATSGWIFSRCTGVDNGDHLRMTVTDALAGNLAQRIAPSQTPVTPGRRYTITGEGRSNSLSPMVVGIQFHDSGGTFIPGSFSVGSATVVNNVTFTTIATHSAVAPPTAAFMVPQWGLGSGTRSIGDTFDVRSAAVTDGITFEDPELPYDDIVFSYDDETIANQVRIAAVGGAVQTANDTASQAEYLIRTFERTDLIMETDAVALGYAQYIRNIAKDPELRISELTINPLRHPGVLFPQVLGREIGDRITVNLTPPGGGSAISQDVFIRGITHEMGVDSWTTRWVFQSAAKAQSVFIVGHAQYGRLGLNALAY